MALIVPNATATGSSKKFVNINQAEPDSVDLESLGNTQNYIRSGGGVTVASSNSVTVAAGVAVIQGVPYSFSSSTVTETLPTTDSRFDLVVARLTSGSVSVVVITGTADATNPTLPQSKSTLLSGVSTANTYDPATDAVIASIYLISGTPLDTSENCRNVVDKRVLSAAPVTYTSASAPTHSAKDVIGDTVIYSGNTYIKTAASTWAQIATTTDTEAARIPIGGIFAFAGTHNTTASPNPAYYLECDGSSLAVGSAGSTYYALHQVIGYSFGGSGANFNLPNLTGDTGVVGASPAQMASSKTASSSNTNSLTSVDQLPSHNHGGSTTVNFGTKSISGTAASHQHYVQDGIAQTASGVSFVRRWNTYNGISYAIPTIANSGGGGMAVDYAFLTDNNGSPLTLSGTVDVGSASGTISSQGSSATFSILSKSIRVRWFIRYA